MLRIARLRMGSGHAKYLKYRQISSKKGLKTGLEWHF